MRNKERKRETYIQKWGERNTEEREIRETEKHLHRENRIVGREKHRRKRKTEIQINVCM